MFVLGYDVADATVRNRIMRRLRRETGYYQQSFFELDVPPAVALALFEELASEMDAGTDGLVMGGVWRPQGDHGLAALPGGFSSGIFLMG